MSRNIRVLVDLAMYSTTYSFAKTVFFRQRCLIMHVVLSSVTVPMYECIYVCIYALCMYVYVCVCMCVYVCVCMYVYVCMYVCV
jgi:hypothetical protein